MVSKWGWACRGGEVAVPSADLCECLKQHQLTIPILAMSCPWVVNSCDAGTPKSRPSGRPDGYLVKGWLLVEGGRGVCLGGREAEVGCLEMTLQTSDHHWAGVSSVCLSIYPSLLGPEILVTTLADQSLASSFQSKNHLSQLHTLPP